MKVKELIEKLQQFDPELPVLINDSEWCAFDIKRVLSSADVDWIECFHEFPSEFVFLDPSEK